VDRAGAEAALERGKDKLGSISKQGDRYLRGLFTASALAVIVMPRSMAASVDRSSLRY
jgi:hypothetical protein